MQVQYIPDMRGVRVVTRHAEIGTIVGPALDPARCAVRPDGDAGVVESFTPLIRSLVTVDYIRSLIARGDEHIAREFGDNIVDAVLTEDDWNVNAARTEEH